MSNDLFVIIIGAVLAAIGGIFGAYRKGKHDRSKEIDSERLESTLKAKETKERVENMDDDDVIAEFDRLRNKRR